MLGKDCAAPCPLCSASSRHHRYRMHAARSAERLSGHQDHAVRAFGEPTDYRSTREHATSSRRPGLTPLPSSVPSSRFRFEIILSPEYVQWRSSSRQCVHAHTRLALQLTHRSPVPAAIYSMGPAFAAEDLSLAEKKHAQATVVDDEKVYANGEETDLRQTEAHFDRECARSGWPSIQRDC